ncbi:MAG TPA: nucleoside hydrolase [Candidatus Acidoferrum sp.]|nr:nucleoside hydrolase [Candidatus Acidoferrum sp.]
MNGPLSVRFSRSASILADRLFPGLALILLWILCCIPASAQQRIKIIVDQDARGPGTSDQQALLVFLQSDKFDVLGITTVSGDQWVKEETQHTLRTLEIADRTDVPVIEGAEYPLLNSKEESERWEALYGKFEYKGCWTDFFKAQRSTIYDMPYHPPDVVPPMPEGEPRTKAQPGTAAAFIVRVVHKYPGQVVLWAGGPLTNYALALKLDPEVATLAKEFVMMGGGFYSDTGGIDPGAHDGRREFNWWFDPEAARIVLRAPWKKITITPIDISVKTHLSPEIRAAIAKVKTPVTEYLDKYSLTGFMWDEIAGAALIDPSIITGEKQYYMDVDIDHGASYGKTLFWGSTAEVPPYLHLANVQFDIDAPKFYKLYIDLMTRPPGQARTSHTSPQ